MQRFGALLVAVLAMGCGSDPASPIYGKWHVDSSSVTSGRLAPGADKKPDWTDATAALSKVLVTFTKQPKSATCEGLGATSRASWAIRGSRITFVDKVPSNEEWPDMVFDSRTSRIHATMGSGTESLQFDLVKE